MPRLVRPPLALYIHLPWCVARCPYCDFNSHALKGALPETAYVDALLADLELDAPRVRGREVRSVFLGGGTPSLFSAAAVERLLAGVRARVRLAADAEITLEANPGSVEHDRFEAYRVAGVNRISLGIQSFNDGFLKSLGRIHSAAEARAAIEAVRRAGFGNFNLDLMWALPGQRVEDAVADLEEALEFGPPHVSHYQLTIEPNTVFAARPPAQLPDEDAAWDMQQACAGLFSRAGLENYEISAWARPGRACRHNLNYWRFGDYLGIGAGASGKLTLPAADTILRTRRRRIPHAYLAAAGDRSFMADETAVAAPDRALEYFLNRSRLAEPMPIAEFEALTGMPAESIGPALERAERLELICREGGLIHRTARGARFLNELQALFLPDCRPGRQAAPSALVKYPG